MFDKEILKGINECSYTGLEESIPNSYGVKVFKDSFGDYRVVSPCGHSALSLHKESDKVFLIDGIFTHPLHRRQGLARQVLAATKMIIKARLHHGDMLTISGERFFKKIDQ